MSTIGVYSPEMRQREKQLSRERDDRDLRAGLISPDELAAVNGFFSSLDISRARIGRRGRLAV